MVTAKQFVRMADRIREELVLLHHQRYSQLLGRTAKASNEFLELSQGSRALARSLDRGWLAAAENSHDRLGRDLSVLFHTLGDLHRLSQAPQVELPSVRTLYEELRQVQEEFDGFTFDVKANRVSIQTPPVELNGTYLGPFEIQLEIQNLWRHAAQGSYRVLARDPHPASLNEDVTHPHVSGQRLCEGEGAAAINMALHEGRLYDFFTLVVHIINTYNPDSAYVSLENWVSRSCEECGGVMSEDEVYTCQNCENDFCDSCSSYCRNCEATLCLGCLDYCAICKDSVCDHCLSTCRECGRSICVSCMSETQRVCSDCQTEMEENSHDESDENENAESQARTEENNAGENTGIPNQHERQAGSVPARL